MEGHPLSFPIADTDFFSECIWVGLDLRVLIFIDNVGVWKSISSMPQHTRISFTLPSLQGAYWSPVLPFQTPPFLELDPNADSRNQALL